MKKVIELTKVLLKSSFSSMNSSMGISTKNKKILPKILYLLLFLYIGGVVAFLSYNLLDGFIKLNQPDVFVGMILFSIIGFATFQSIFSTINILYFTKDSEYILPLPLKPYQIILSKTIVLIVLEYIIEIFIGVLPLTIYGIQTGREIMYYFVMLIGLLLIPILPVILVSTLIMIIMSFARLTKNKNRFQIIATIITIILVVLVALATGNINEDMTNEQMAEMILKANGMVELLKGYFPSLDYLITALTSNQISVIAIEIIKTIGITIIGLGIYLFIADKIYLKGLVGNLFGGNGRKVNTKIKQESYENSKLCKSYIGKEFKTLARNPIFLMQCLAPAIILPLIIIGLTYMQFTNIESEAIQMLINEFDMNTLPVACTILGIIEFFTMFVYISITAISREGKNAVFIKYIPVPLYKQYIYKIVPNMIMSILSIIITLVIAQILLNLKIAIICLIFIVAIIMSLLQSILMLIIDLKRPKLEWDSEYAVVKQNFNLIFPAIYGIVAIGILVVIGVFLGNLNVYLGLGSLTLLFGIITYFTNRYLYKNQEELSKKVL